MSSSGSLAAKYMPSNNETCMLRPTLIDLNPFELNYYPFMIKVFNLITRINEAKTLVKHILYDCEYKIDSTTCNSNEKWNYDKCQCKCKNYRSCNKYYCWNPSTCICEKSKYLKHVADDSVIVYDEVINATDSVAINVTNAIPTKCDKCYTKKYDKYYINKHREYCVNKF